MKMTVVSIERHDGKYFHWYDANVRLENGMVLDAFFEMNEREFRLFNSEDLTWPERDAIRDKLLKLFDSLTSLEQAA